MLEAQQDFDLSQGALTVGLMLEGADLLNGHTDLIVTVIGSAGSWKRLKNIYG